MSAHISATQPATTACKVEAQSEYVQVAYTFCARLAPELRARSALGNEISASELRRKLVKSALLVGVASWPYFLIFPIVVHELFHMVHRACSGAKSSPLCTFWIGGYQ